MQIRAINIIGAGSLGSFTTMLIGKEAPVLECPINIFDFDVVEARNIGNQLYRPLDVGRPKVEALRDVIADMDTVEINISKLRVSSVSEMAGIAVVLIDSMAGRKSIFESSCYDATIPYYIEARTGNNTARIYAFNPRCKDWVKRYGKTLCDDSQIPERACADRETVPSLWAVASSIAGILVSLKKQKVFRNEFLEIIINFGNWPTINTQVIEDL